MDGDIGRVGSIGPDKYSDLDQPHFTVARSVI